MPDSLEDQGLILEFSKNDLLSFEDKLLVVVVRLHLKGFPYFTSKYMTGSIYSDAYLSAGD